jgi:23S rRNA pseudouridine1911/1915/1917 synthase
MNAPPQRFAFKIAAPQIGMRLDVVLADQLEDCSRSYAGHLIQEGAVAVNGKPCKSSYRVRLHDAVAGELPPPTLSTFKAEPIPLTILYEDAHLLVIDKPPGLVVHPAPGHVQGTLVNALLYHCPDLAAFSGEIRPGIVHRLDKDTSGALVVAKTPTVHEHLALQFKQRTVRKTYLALVWGEVKAARGVVRLPVGRHPVHRKRMTTTAPRARAAETHYRVRERLPGTSLLELDLKTGRTHQIRVHCAALHHPVLGDTVYGGRNAKRIVQTGRAGDRQTLQVKRQMLHAWRLGFLHPVHMEWRQFEADLPADMQAVLDFLRKGAVG